MLVGGCGDVPAREWQWYWNSFRNIQNILLPPEGVHLLCSKVLNFRHAVMP